jgi:hypothetical protein
MPRSTSAVIIWKPLAICESRHVYGLWSPFRRWKRVDSVPHFPHTCSLCREHAVLQTVEILSIYRRHKLARQEAQKHTGRKVVLPYPVSHLEILVEHGLKVKRDRLYQIVVVSSSTITTSGAFAHLHVYDRGQRLSSAIRTASKSIILGISKFETNAT